MVIFRNTRFRGVRRQTYHFCEKFMPNFYLKVEHKYLDLIVVQSLMLEYMDEEIFFKIFYFIFQSISNKIGFGSNNL